MENWDIMIWGEAGSRKFTLNLLDGILCLFISKIKRRPFIVWFGGWEFTQRDHWQDAHIINTFKRIGALFIIPWLLRKAEAIVTYGNFHKNFYTFILGINPHKIFIAPNSSIISEDEAESEKQMNILREKLRLEGKKIILYVGRLEKRKNVDILIKAFAQIKRDDVCLLIIGDGESRPYLEKLCKQLELRNVYFLGRIERDKLPPYYRLCTVFVYPTAREPWGLAINEAMQFGKPVIATPRVAATHDLIKQGINGFIVPENDFQALAKAINRIILDEESAKRMGQRSREIIIQGFTYEHMAEGFREAIRYCRHKK
jgi:glycosyltransferase involved in cell wall biosynthesis